MYGHYLSRCFPQHDNTVHALSVERLAKQSNSPSSEKFSHLWILAEAAISDYSQIRPAAYLERHG